MSKSETIAITGATGAVGWRAVARLLAAGHGVIGVTRSDRGRTLLEGLGARAIEADVFDDEDLGRAFAGAGVVVNLLTHIPRIGRMVIPGAWRENDRLMREASGVVARAAAAAGARLLVQESACYLYADGGHGWLDEGAMLDAAGAPASALAAEHNASREFGRSTVLLRFGAFIGPGSHHSWAHLGAARRGLSLWPGSKNAYVPTVWLDDAARAVAVALGLPAGVYNVVDHDPPTRAELDAALASAVGRRRLLAPAIALARVVPATRPLTRSLRVSNRRLREASEWVPQVRGGTEGWVHVNASPWPHPPETSPVPPSGG